MPRGRALGFMMSLPEEDRYVLSKDELEDWLKVTLAGRAAEQVVFGRITNGAANDLDRATAIARSMVFDWGMGARPRSHSRCAPTTTRCPRRRSGCATPSSGRSPTRRTPRRVRLVSRYRPHLDRLAQALLERETLDRPEIDRLLEGLEPESDASGLIGVALPDDDDVAHANGNGTWGCRSRCSAQRSRSSPPRTSVEVESGASASVGDLLGLGLDGLARRLVAASCRRSPAPWPRSASGGR